MNKKIDILKKEFLTHGYMLETKEINTLTKQLERKPLQLYLLAIKYILKNNEKVNYEKVESLIIIDIRIRDNLKKIITSLEESIRVWYIDSKCEIDDFSCLKKENNKNLKEIINTLGKPSLNDIRIIRNQISHIVYPLIYEEFDLIIKKLINFIKFDFVDKKILKKYIKSIKETNRGMSINFIDEKFKNIPND